MKITFLRRYFLRLKSCFIRLVKKEIPFEVSKDELLVRAIGSFLFYSTSDNKLKREAFLPPPDKTDVSLLRRNYTTDDFCKKQGMSLKMHGYQYCGLAIFYSYQIDEINADHQVVVKPVVHGTPIDENGNYVENPPVYTSSLGLPMHADLVYPVPAIKGQVNTSYRIFAQQMIKKAIFLSDPYPTEDGSWRGTPLLSITI
jgi:hypothetical protein